MWTAEVVLTCALGLLGRSQRSFPPIELVTAPPADVSAGAEAFVRANSRRIYVLATSATFQRLQFARDKCGDIMAARKLASVLVHEEVHLRHGWDEEEAYAAQLTTLTALGAGVGTPPYQETVRAWRQARQRAPAAVRVVVSTPAEEDLNGWSWSAPISGLRAALTARR